MARTASIKRWLLRSAATVAALIVVAVAAWYLWIGPAVIRGEVAAALGKYWAGRVEVGSASFRLFSPPVVGEVALYDNDGRLWLRAARVAPELRDWPSASPAVTGVRIDGVQIVAHMLQGRVDPPLHAAAQLSFSGQGAAAAGPNISTIDIHDADATILSHDEGGERLGLAGLALVISRADGNDANGAYDLSLSQSRAGSAAQSLVRGRIHPKTGQIHLAIKAHTDLKAADAALLANVLSPNLPELSGKADVDVTVDGRAGEPNSFCVSGTADVRGVRMATAKGVVLEDVTLAMELNGQRGVATGHVRTPIGTLHLDNVPIALEPNQMRLAATLKDAVADLAAGAESGRFWNETLSDTIAQGRATVDGRASLGLREPWGFGCNLRARTELKNLTIAGNARHAMRDVRATLAVRRSRISVTGLDALYAQGRLKGDMELWLVRQEGRRPRWSDWNRAELVQGEIRATLDNVDTLVVPLVPDLMAQLGQAALQPLRSDTQGFSQGAGVFSLAGGVLTFQSARLANPISALEFEPGGTINLRNKQLDFHVVGVALTALRDVLVKIPLVNLMVNFKDKIVRVRVKGPWDADSSTLISKEPVGDLAKGTTDFFKGVAESGGKLGPAIIKGVTDIFTLPGKLLGTED